MDGPERRLGPREEEAQSQTGPLSDFPKEGGKRRVGWEPVVGSTHKNYLLYSREVRCGT